MTQSKKEAIKKCFIIAPIGEMNSEIRRSLEGLLTVSINPVLNEIGYTPFWPHRMQDPGSITKQVIQHLLEDEIVIANLTGLNPNVMYELAVRHAAQLPVVTIAEIGTKIPFDIQDERTLFFTNDALGCNELKSQLKEAIEKAADDDEPDNPIYRAQKSKIMKEQAETTDIQAYILDQLEGIQSQLGRLYTNNKKVEQNNISRKPIISDDETRIYILEAKPERIEKMLVDFSEVTPAFNTTSFWTLFPLVDNKTILILSTTSLIHMDFNDYISKEKIQFIEKSTNTNK